MTQVVVLGSVEVLSGYRSVKPDYEEMAQVLMEDEKTVFVGSGLDKGFWDGAKDFFRRLGMNWTRTVFVDAEKDVEASGLGLDELVKFWEKVLEGVEETPYITFNIKKRVSRRVFVKFGASALLEYTGVPTVKRTKCASFPECSQCIGICPYGALEGKPPTVNTDKCVECGLCVSACPIGLITNPAFPENLAKMIIDQAATKGITRLVITCGKSRDKAYLEKKKGLFIEVPCIASFPVWMIAYAQQRGVGIEFYCDKETRERCSKKEASERYMEYLGEMDKAFYLDEETLGEAESILAITGARAQLFKKLPQRTREWVKISLPLFFRIDVDSERCTLCGVCAEKCPISALILEKNKEGYHLYFHHDRCIGCNLCVRFCPEKAISIEKAVNPRFLNERLQLDFSYPARCKVCGKDIGPEKKIRKIEEQLKTMKASSTVVSNIRICRECKFKSQFAGLV